MALITSACINGPYHLAPLCCTSSWQTGPERCASLFMQHMWTVDQHDGPNHLGLWLNQVRRAGRPAPSAAGRGRCAGGRANVDCPQHDGTNHLGLWLGALAGELAAIVAGLGAGGGGGMLACCRDDGEGSAEAPPSKY